MAFNPAGFLTAHFEKLRKQEEDLRAKYGNDFDKTDNSFTVKVAEQKCIDDWLESLVPEILQKQGKVPVGFEGQPYYGAVGGGVSYTFVATSLGTILTVKETTTGKELNVTDALGWYFYD